MKNCTEIFLFIRNVSLEVEPARNQERQNSQIPLKKLNPFTMTENILKVEENEALK